MAAGQARAAHERTGRRVIIYDRHGQIRWHQMWANNPHIVTRNERIDMMRTMSITNGPGARPYIGKKTDTHWGWREWECPKGDIYFDKFEQEFGAIHLGSWVVIEPNNKQNASPNKDWGRAHWASLIDLMHKNGIEPVQLGAVGTQVMHGVRLITTPTFRMACAVLARARAAVLPEGGMHHAAAALNVKSVVIFGGYISPKQTGYVTQTNVFTGGVPCGSRMPCAHCAKAMGDIAPTMVMDELRKLLI